MDTLGLFLKLLSAFVIVCGIPMAVAAPSPASIKSIGKAISSASEEAAGAAKSLGPSSKSEALGDASKELSLPRRGAMNASTPSGAAHSPEMGSPYTPLHSVLEVTRAARVLDRCVAGLLDREPLLSFNYAERQCQLKFTNCMETRKKASDDPYNSCMQDLDRDGISNTPPGRAKETRKN
jgi:hypothetical protein